MSSETITRNDLTNILNEVLPTPRYGGIYSASWSVSSHSAYNLKLTGDMSLPAGTYVVIIISPYVSSGTAFLSPRVNGTQDATRLLTCTTGVNNGAFIMSLNSTSTVAVYSESSSATSYTDIERAGLYAIQISDANIQTNVADYIVEQGTDGNWIYRKWNSGVAEAWIKATRNTSLASNAQANLSLPLPTFFVNELPIATGSGGGTSQPNAFLAYTNVYGTSGAYGIDSYVRNNGGSACASQWVYFYVIGKWK